MVGVVKARSLLTCLPWRKSIWKASPGIDITWGPYDCTAGKRVSQSLDPLRDPHHSSSGPTPQDQDSVNISLVESALVGTSAQEQSPVGEVTAAPRGQVCSQAMVEPQGQLYGGPSILYGDQCFESSSTGKDTDVYVTVECSESDMIISEIKISLYKLSRFTSNPSRQHWQAITRVFKYLKGTMNYGLSYMGYPSVLEGYSDASWINHVEDSSSTSGWVFLLGGGAISWASKKQTCITGSTMESEFVALAAAGKEAEWLRNLIHEIPIWPKPIAPISIRCDSAPTMAKAYSQIYNGKSRHLDTQFPSNTTLEAEFNVESSHLEIGTRVFIFPRCKTKRITYVNMKFCRFKKLGLGFLYVH
ncbi:hypothetical protein Tco_0593779 [Tanacetum coccineum]